MIVPALHWVRAIHRFAAGVVATLAVISCHAEGLRRISVSGDFSLSIVLCEAGVAPRHPVRLRHALQENTRGGWESVWSLSGLETSAILVGKGTVRWRDLSGDETILTVGTRSPEGVSATIPSSGELHIETAGGWRYRYRDGVLFEIGEPGGGIYFAEATYGRVHRVRAADGTLLFHARYDRKGRLNSFASQGKEFHFNYAAEDVKLTGILDGKTEIASFSYEGGLCSRVCSVQAGNFSLQWRKTQWDELLPYGVALKSDGQFRYEIKSEVLVTRLAAAPIDGTGEKENLVVARNRARN